jgi:hypothetical protein
MGWRDRLLELLARGIRTPDGEPLEPELVVRLHDRISADPDLSARLDKLDKADFRCEFLALYQTERNRDP